MFISKRMFALAAAALTLVAVAWPGRTASAQTPISGQVITRFLPSRDGLTFRNPARNPSDPLLQQLTTEQCGGMAFVALDYFAAGTRPIVESARDASIQVRSAESIASNGSRFLLWSMWPDRSRHPLEAGVVTLTRNDELPKLQAALAKGPVPLGLVRARSATDVGLNHQVVAYRMKRDGDIVTIGIYDPTQPGADDVELVTDLSDESGVISERAGEWELARWRGLFVERYAPRSTTVEAR